KFCTHCGTKATEVSRSNNSTSGGWTARASGNSDNHIKTPTRESNKDLAKDQTNKFKVKEKENQKEQPASTPEFAKVQLKRAKPPPPRTTAATDNAPAFASVQLRSVSGSATPAKPASPPPKPTSLASKPAPNTSS